MISLINIKWLISITVTDLLLVKQELMFDTCEIYICASVQEVDCLTKHDNHVHKYVHPDKLRLSVSGG